jgi:hypothetical protein
LEKEEFDCALEDDEEPELSAEEKPEEKSEPEMTQEIEGSDEEISPIERWQASVSAHEAAVTDRRVAPEIAEHPDGHKSQKQTHRMEQELQRAATVRRFQENLNLAAKADKGKAVQASTPISKSALSVPAVIPAIPDVRVRLFIFGEYRKTITVPENISKEDLRNWASYEFQGRVAIRPEVFPVRAESIVICCPSFVPEIGGKEIPVPTVVLCLERGERLCPVEVPECNIRRHGYGDLKCNRMPMPSEDGYSFPAPHG